MSQSLQAEDLEDLAKCVEEYLDARQFRPIKKLLNPLHPGDVAGIIQYLNPGLRQLFLDKCWPLKDGGEVLTHLDATVREDLVSLLGPEKVAKALVSLESDDAYLLVEELPEEERAQVLATLDPLKRKNIEVREAYPKNSAARLMQQELVAMPETWSVEEALDFLHKQKQLPDLFYDLYLVDEKWRLKGRVPLSLLMRAKPETKLATLQDNDIHTLTADTDQEEAALDFKRYSLISAPVVSTSGHLLGVITADDILNVVDREAEEDILHLGGIGASDFYAPVLPTAFSRFQWLLITFLNTILASAVISQFQVVLEQKVALAVLMPIVAAMGGNAGMQVVTVMVRALATNELSTTNLWRTLTKSCLVSFINGLLFAFLLSTIAAVWFHDTRLGIVLGSAMLFNMLWAGISGTLLPIFADRLGIDPALSAAPILTTTTDVLGYAIFLGLAWHFLF